MKTYKMKQIILDFGSGNTCLNNKLIIQEMYDKLELIDKHRYDVIVKWQLFQQVGNNIPLNKKAFDYAYHYGKQLGYEVTASIFDKTSLDFLMGYNVPFIKIANNSKLHYLIKNIPEDIMLYISSDLPLYLERRKATYKHLWCVSKYPALVSDYEKFKLKKGACLSDHTPDFKLFFANSPEVIEWHYKLDNSVGLDAGVFARTPEQLNKIL